MVPVDWHSFSVGFDCSRPMVGLARVGARVASTIAELAGPLLARTWLDNGPRKATLEIDSLLNHEPVLGRFLSVDLIAGGNSNDYNYPDDPVNESDVSGEMPLINNQVVYSPKVENRLLEGLRSERAASTPTCGLRDAHGTYCEISGSLAPEGKPAGGVAHVPTSASISGEVCAGACLDLELDLGKKTELAVAGGWGPKAGLAGSFGGDVGEKSGWNLEEKCTAVPGLGGYEEVSWDDKNEWSGGVGGSVGAEVGCAAMAGYTFSW
jgi:hypothetical protein